MSLSMIYRVLQSQPAREYGLRDRVIKTCGGLYWSQPAREDGLRGIKARYRMYQQQSQPTREKLTCGLVMDCQYVLCFNKGEVYYGLQVG